ncbi:L,D-transpeptidase [Baekduia sp. Peel2402]|uniref:L,D-transpeptidase n=1 Tax=Baekduia sp. Peel2402 TaxID=3458296 RepID=UPI00403E654F
MSLRRAAGPRPAHAAALLVAVVLGALILSGCGADVEPQTTSTTAAVPSQTLRTTPNPDAEKPAPAAKPKLSGPLAFHVRHRTQLRVKPGGKMVATIKTKTEFKSPTILAVAARKPGWVLVRTTLAKHHVGWLPVASGALFEQPRTIVIDLSAKTLTVFHRGKLTDRYRVAIGTSATPTPTGKYAVTDRLKTGDENSDYGCCILALNGHQEKIAQGWGGGDRIAIHATPHTWTIGKAVSHGCVRATNKALHQLMRKVRIGTPVRIKT